MKPYLFIAFAILTLSNICFAKETTCYRTAKEGEVPFIKTSDTDLTLLVEKKGRGRFQGVHFKHSKDKPSPHVTTTHVESAYHVFGGKKKGAAEKLSAVLQKNPNYLKPLKGLCIKVKPSLVKVKVRGNTWKMGRDSYLITKDIKPKPQELVVTKKAVQEALKGVQAKAAQVILIQIEGGEAYAKDWPYLTNTAFRYITSTLKPAIVALNTPSVDREQDNGVTSNHKVIFKDMNRLVLEMGNFQALDQGPHTVSLNLQLEGKSQFEDCAPSLLVASKG